MQHTAFWIGHLAGALLAAGLAVGFAAGFAAGCSIGFEETPGGLPGDDDGGDDDVGDDDGGDDDAGDDDAGDDDAGDDDGGDDDSGDDDSGPQDADGDGYTPADGDCDDNNANVYPGAVDVCDELDNDCDGEMNEDSAGYDGYEPNDAQGYDLGDLTDLSAQVDSYIHGPGDLDRFRFEVVDVPFGWFGVDLELTLVPGNVDLALELELIQDSDGAYVGVVDWADQAGGGGNEYLSYGGFPGLDDGGIYEAIVEPVSGFDCATFYTLIITASG
jgi:hypothetical protein